MNFVKGMPPKLLRDKAGIYQGGANRVGWQGEMDRCWVDNDANICVCSRLIRTKFGKVEHVTITKGTGTRNGEGEITWAQKQQIKNELFGEDRFAIEVFPKQKKLVVYAMCIICGYSTRNSKCRSGSARANISRLLTVDMILPRRMLRGSEPITSGRARCENGRRADGRTDM